MQIVHRLPSSGLLGQWCWAAAIAWLSHRTEHDNLHAAVTTERNAASPVTGCHPSQRHESASPAAYGRPTPDGARWPVEWRRCSPRGPNRPRRRRTVSAQDRQHVCVEVPVADDEVTKPGAVEIAALGGQGQQGRVDEQFLESVADVAGGNVYADPLLHSDVLTAADGDSPKRGSRQMSAFFPRAALHKNPGLDDRAAP